MIIYVLIAVPWVKQPATNNTDRKEKMKSLINKFLLTTQGFLVPQGSSWTSKLRGPGYSSSLRTLGMAAGWGSNGGSSICGSWTSCFGV